MEASPRRKPLSHMMINCFLRTLDGRCLCKWQLIILIFSFFPSLQACYPLEAILCGGSGDPVTIVQQLLSNSFPRKWEICLTEGLISPFSTIDRCPESTPVISLVRIAAGFKAFPNVDSVSSKSLPRIQSSAILTFMASHGLLKALAAACLLGIFLFGAAGEPFSPYTSKQAMLTCINQCITMLHLAPALCSSKHCPDHRSREILIALPSGIPNWAHLFSPAVLAANYPLHFSSCTYITRVPEQLLDG